MSDEENVKHDIAEHVEHLRTIHFSLLISCGALLIAVQFLPDQTLLNALSQIKKLRNDIAPNLNHEFIKGFSNEVVQEVKILSSSEGGLNDHDKVINRLRGFIGNTDSRPLNIPANYRDFPKIEYWAPKNPSDTRKSVSFDGNESYCCLLTLGYQGQEHRFNVFIKAKPDVNPHYLEQKTITPIENDSILDTEKAWNAFIEHKTLRIPWSWNLIVEDVVPVIEKGALEKLTAKLAYEGEKSGDKLLLTATTGDLLEGVGVFSLQNESQRITFHVRAKYLISYLDVDIEIGKWLSEISNDRFEKTFRDLQIIRQRLDIREKSLKGIEAIINEEVKVKSESISIFSLKIPGALIRNWGAAILIGFQLYYLMHLKFYCVLLERDYTFKVPWIGYYDDYLSKFVTFATSLIMPPVTVVVILWNRLYDPRFQYHITLLLVMTVSIVISISTFKFIFFIWTKHKNVISQSLSRLIQPDAPAPQTPPVNPTRPPHERRRRRSKPAQKPDAPRP